MKEKNRARHRGQSTALFSVTRCQLHQHKKIENKQNVEQRDFETVFETRKYSTLKTISLPGVKLLVMVNPSSYSVQNQHNKYKRRQCF